MVVNNDAISWGLGSLYLHYIDWILYTDVLLCTTLPAFSWSPVKYVDIWIYFIYQLNIFECDKPTQSVIIIAIVYCNHVYQVHNEIFTKSTILKSKLSEADSSKTEIKHSWSEVFFKIHPTTIPLTHSCLFLGNMLTSYKIFSS